MEHVARAPRFEGAQLRGVIVRRLRQRRRRDDGEKD
jgi:hypothetical protein